MENHPEPVSIQEYACGVCGIRAGDRSLVVDHCACSEEGCGNPKRSGWTMCDDHLASKRAADETARIAAMVPVPSGTGPWYCENTDEYTDTDPDVLVEDCVYDGVEPADIVIVPCDVRRARCMDLAETVLDSWSERFADRGEELTFSPKTAAAVTAAQEAIERTAPELWHPRKGERVDVAATAARMHAGLGAT